MTRSQYLGKQGRLERHLAVISKGGETINRRWISAPVGADQRALVNEICRVMDYNRKQCDAFEAVGVSTIVNVAGVGVSIKITPEQYVKR